MRIRLSPSVIHFPGSEWENEGQENMTIIINNPSNDASIAVHTSGERGSRKPQGSTSGTPRLLTILILSPKRYGV
ncbi:hypothetical protein Pmani_000357 [Petrolisthes manimaculis]|uniref:Uncharacterized protein n=1 Tax=Petrolisthes manimaculis TaxID=1843537 RepID=A0AAE1QPF4_9EUCA|nr:hypothetical protein Pmani_020954 [Petrolisthes manimaculis]KAK4310308.1 hypothetical protein Pmani_018127 [Petrolisthes manimaculis]KAK4314409.1 hypothetical protein Pmani_014296 [Petrolisthes manimaculis]KAK4314417.1 hypothetical protein Pmani_014304 [Petrolisthes manimaculis]KAK4329323.1 hypothetical protein Pmani_000357 [Petrolisthes manimaculis]